MRSDSVRGKILRGFEVCFCPSMATLLSLWSLTVLWFWKPTLTWSISALSSSVTFNLSLRSFCDQTIKLLLFILMKLQMKHDWMYCVISLQCIPKAIKMLLPVSPNKTCQFQQKRATFSDFIWSNLLIYDKHSVKSECGLSLEDWKSWSYHLNLFYEVMLNEQMLLDTQNHYQK